VPASKTLQGVPAAAGSLKKALAIKRSATLLPSATCSEVTSKSTLVGLASTIAGLTKTSSAATREQVNLFMAIYPLKISLVFINISCKAKLKKALDIYLY
jgi:hypothetical protein